ncbi:hypothetical protein [Nocardiopsis quinghaiensis]|uniref:hypothetical protein n=1 Tax=Nocardiopsis quinghaiensis TaxID=464995 RepID=UPI00123BE14B|nr:hypothetical protein [Nocardiopsis quinghaiensis]
MSSGTAISGPDVSAPAPRPEHCTTGRDFWHGAEPDLDAHLTRVGLSGGLPPTPEAPAPAPLPAPRGPGRGLLEPVPLTAGHQGPRAGGACAWTVWRRCPASPSTMGDGP